VVAIDALARQGEGDVLRDRAIVLDQEDGGAHRMCSDVEGWGGLAEGACTLLRARSHARAAVLRDS
jgi:hypothetical protein